MVPFDPFSLDSYDFDLPERLIAQKPVEPRDSSRLLVVDRASGEISHRTFRDLPEYLGSNDSIVLNNTRVIRARMKGHRRLPEGKIGGEIEFVALEKIAPLTWEGLLRSSARQLAGMEIAIQDSRETREPIPGVLVRGSSESPSGTVVVQFESDPVDQGYGNLPLPHYIERAGGLKPEDEENYQTVFSKTEGSAAAPTAGLHFTPAVFERLAARGVRREEVTLHVGLGTFRPVKTSDIRSHSMHEERYFLDEGTADRIQNQLSSGGRIVAVGTTSVRTLESAWDRDSKKFRTGEQRTSIFIHPEGRGFEVVGALLTNFHLPKSTLLMLVCAFAGRELALEAYRQAVEREYRFFSYGDAMLIL